MDSITHIVLGAAMGEVLAGRKLGKKALLIGAVANSLPDIDFVASFWLDTSRDVWFHRGITHSFLFVLLMTALLAFIARKVYPLSGMTGKAWWLFFGSELSAHIFIDAFNAYGTGWLEPFSHYRVTFNVLFVADPFYSCWLGIAAAALVILRRDSRLRRGWAWWGLSASSLYLCYCLVNKGQIDRVVERELGRQGIRYDRYFTTPTPLNSWLWYVVVEDSGGYHTGYRSVFDSRSRPIAFRWQPRNEAALGPFHGRGDIDYLLRFSQGYYTVGKWGDSLVFNVLRFGEIRGWADPAAPFVFHYFLQYPEDNRLVVQRGRFAGWDGKTWREFIRRIEGD